MVLFSSKRERIFWVSLLCLLFVISGFIISGYQKSLHTTKQQVADLESEKAAWAGKEQDLTSEIAELRAQLDQNAAISKEFPMNDPQIRKELERQGLDGGSDELIADLLKHNELIPFDGVLGGKMTFWKDKVFVISDRWIIAYFEDGHISGNMLLRYDVENGVISWKVIDSYLY